MAPQMADFCIEDYDLYSELFDQHSTAIIGLMRILDQKIVADLALPVTRPRELFRMVMDLSYEVDRLYKKEKNIKDEWHVIDSTRMGQDMIDQMKTVLQSEFNHYLGEGNE